MKQHCGILWMSLALAAATLPACGQRGPLYLPDTPASRERASLPETLWPGSADKAQTSPSDAPPAAAEPQPAPQK